MRLVVIDGNAIVHRAYHALPPLATKDGLMVNAVYGFTSMLLKVLQDLKPTHLAVSFDVAGGTFRHKKYEQYKATRAKADQELYDQIPLVHEVVQAFGLPIYEKQGYEADDVIGTIVSQAKNKEREIFVVTGDKDAIQLVDENVKVYALRKGMSDVVIYDKAEAKKRFGFEPELLVDYKALAGDQSDNIPGVPGIGEKTATELIQKIGGIDAIYKVIKAGEKKPDLKESVIKKMQAGEEKARMSYELAKIDSAVPELDFKIQDCELKELDREKIAVLFQKFEFTSLLKRLPGAGKVGEVRPAGKEPDKKLGSKQNPVKRPAHTPEYEEIKDDKGLGRVEKEVCALGLFACRGIVVGDTIDGKLTGIIIVVGEQAYYVPAGVFEANKRFWSHLFSDKKLELVGHDLKHLVKVLGQRGIVVNNKLFDTMMASYLLNPGSRAHDAAGVVLKILGRELPIAASQTSLFGVDMRALAEELFLISQTVEKLKHELEETENLGLLQKIEMPLIPVLAQMETNGVAIDSAALKRLSVEVVDEIKKVSGRIYQLTGVEFNIASPLQLREVLFEKLEIPVGGIKKGKTGLSTSAEQLEKMRGLHPVIDEVVNYRELAKLQNTYIDVLPTLVNKQTGRIHTSFNQAVTATGRLSSSDPNLQNIPIRTKLGRQIRQAFVAEKGSILLSADYSQIELRIVASLAEDKTMLEIFKRGEDIHTATAAAIHSVPLKDVTKDMRRAAKEINFGVLYGMGSYGLSWRAEIPHWQARDFIKKYFERFSGVKKYIDNTLKFVRQEGYCETLFGRRRYLPELNSTNHQLRAAAERMAVNHPVQGTAADIMKLAMIEVHKKIHDSDEAKMILQVHDELVLEVKKGQEDEVGRLVKEAMEGVVELRVPIKVEIGVGQNWGETK